jgi:hypothetical protein
MSVKDARELWRAIRVREGFKPLTPNLLAKGSESNAKLAHTAAVVFLLNLAPADGSGVVNTCPWATAACRAACVMVTGGRNVFADVKRGKRVRTLFAAEHPVAFLTLLAHEVGRLEAKGELFGLRLNASSDVRWERVLPSLFDGANVRAYDYTKAPTSRQTPENYHLTYSVHEGWTDEQIRSTVADGHNVAVVLRRRKGDLPAQHLGLDVIDGDKSDYRFDDRRGGVIVGLAAKGAAIGSTDGFVREVA